MNYLMRNIGLVALAVLSNAMAQPRIIPVAGVTIHGAEKISAEKLLDDFGLKPGMPFALSDLQQRGRRLLQSMASSGFWFARLDSIVYSIAPDSSRAEVRIYLAEGRELRTGAVQISGLDTLLADKLLGRFDSRAGKALNGTVLEEDLDDALLQLDKEGQPFARLELKTLQVDSLDAERDALDSRWQCIPGPRLVLREIQISGNQLTRPGVILREIRLKPGERYSYQKVSQIASRLMQLGYFKKVDEPVLFYTAGDEGGLLLRVEEGQSSRFDGVIGYTPGSGKATGYFTGLVDISLGNLLGTGRSLYAHWQKKDRQTQDISLKYREPWLAGWPLHVAGGFTQLIQDTTYVQRDLSLEVSIPLMDRFSVFTQFSRTHIAPDSLGSYKFGLLRSSLLNAALGLEYDSRDDPINPRQGVFYSTTYQSGRKKNLGPASLLTEEIKREAGTQRITLDLEVYASLFKRQVMAVALHGRQIKSGEAIIPVTDQFRMGGAKSLRGYREDQFRGNSVSWATFEYRYWMGRRSRTFLFTDYGYYSTQTAAGRRQAFQLGYGFGFRLETGLGILGLDYGLGKGDDLMGGKIHVGLINEF